MDSNRTLAAPRRNVGQFDCSGEDIERDWVERAGCWDRVERVLLTYDQVQEYGLPPAEGKRDDPRWPGFAHRFGFDVGHPVQWEVEALPPEELHRRVLEAVDPYVDHQALTAVIAENAASAAPWPPSWTAGRGGRDVALALGGVPRIGVCGHLLQPLETARARRRHEGEVSRAAALRRAREERAAREAGAVVCPGPVPGRS